jgi:hypothetical protein
MIAGEGSDACEGLVTVPLLAGEVPRRLVGCPAAPLSYRCFRFFFHERGKCVRQVHMREMFASGSAKILPNHDS